MMTSRERTERAWDFQEPDRVPLEMSIMESARTDPRSARLCALIDEYADNWGHWSVPWSWMGLNCDPVVDEVIEDRPGEFKRVRHSMKTPAGTFTAITWHPADAIDYHWEKRYISTLDDLEAVTSADHAPRRFDAAGAWREARQRQGEGVFLAAGLPHPFGALVRHADQESVYEWLATEPRRIHRFLDVQIRQLVGELEAFAAVPERLYFMQYGLEMAIPPWMGHAMFDEYIVPYDAPVYACVHRFGAKVRHHCHGNCMDFLVRMADMGIDGTEPLEPPPQGNVILAEAKRLVGDRMLLCGNITSPQFQTMTPDEVEAQVAAACRAAKAGGGFILRTTGGESGTWDARDLGRVLACAERMIEAWLRHGRYD